MWIDVQKQLDEFLSRRKVADGFQFLEGRRTEIALIEPSETDAAGVIVRLAEWVDLGYRPHMAPLYLAKRFDTAWRAKATVKEFLELRIAEGFGAMDEEDLGQAIAHFDFALRAEEELGDVRLAAIAHFWKGRAHRKKGEYGEAMKHVARGREMMQSIGETKLAAVISIQEAWLLFQNGDSANALTVLADAQEKLSSTDDDLSLGNIASARGRIRQQAGDYLPALHHYEEAVKAYARRDPNHRNLARALVNSATVKRLIALQVKKRIDTRAQRAADGVRRRKRNPEVSREEWELYIRMNREAEEQAKRALAIYEKHRYCGGIASALVISGYLNLDNGDVEMAGRAAWRAHFLANDKNDHIHMARARTLLSIVENHYVDEQLGDVAKLTTHATNAKRYAEEAIALAEQTQNRKLAAEAYLASAVVHANEYFQELDEAKRRVDHAVSLIAANERDHLWEDIMSLKTRILRASSVDDKLRAWSQGVLGDKTFQEVTEEFAEMVIPKVWQREGKKVSRVAEKLQISPKKVRRILKNVGLAE